MDKKILLTKLENLFHMKEVSKGFASRNECLTWANRVAPLLEFNEQYYANFMEYSHRLNLSLTASGLADSFRIMKSQVEMAIEELKLKIEMEETIPDQMYFSENSHLDIQKNIAKIIRQAQKSLWVFDAYMDEKIVEELTEVPAAEIKFLTQQTKGLFRQRLAALEQQCPNKTIQTKKSDKSHDRFYIIDQDQVWTLGTSLNKAGEKATLLSKIKADSEKEKIIYDFNSWWDKATKIT